MNKEEIFVGLVVENSDVCWLIGCRFQQYPF